MFRYGGPIKEGIMSGMRQSHKDGERVGLYNVGSPGQFKKTGGREHHYIQALAAVPWLLRAASIPFGRWATQQALKKGVTSAGGNLIRSGLGRTRVMKPGETFLNTLTQAKNKFTPYKFWSQDPLYKAGATGAGWAGKGLKKGYQIAKAGVTTPSGIATTGGLAWMFWPDGTPKTGDDLAKAAAAAGKKPGHGDEGMYYDKPPVTKSAEELAAEAKAARTKKLNKYLDTMGYDKAKKTAMGDALIDASAIVQDATSEAGSLKKADWGKMINKAIQTTSKRLDKPEQIREAVGLMMTKADIEKDATAETDALNKLYKTLQIKGAQKTLAGNTLAEDIREGWKKSEKLPSGNKLAGLARTHGIEVTQVLDTADIPDDMSAIDYITLKVKKSHDDGNPIPKGNYVIKDRLIYIDETGTITDLINQ